MEIKQRIFNSKEQFLEFRSKFRSLFNSRKVVFNPDDFAVYATLRGRDPSKGFTPITNVRKLANGQTANQAKVVCRDRLRVGASNEIQSILGNDDLYEEAVARTRELLK